MKPVLVLTMCALSVAAQTATSTCRSLFEPKTYQDAIVAAPDPRNERPPVIFGEPRRVRPIRIRMLDGSTGKPLRYESIKVNYGWRWLEYPYPEHAWGAWSEAADQIECDLDSHGWMQTPSHEVRPRGWYDGKYTRFPWCVRTQGQSFRSSWRAIYGSRHCRGYDERSLRQRQPGAARTRQDRECGPNRSRLRWVSHKLVVGFKGR
jgi:hypothetical protein